MKFKKSYLMKLAGAALTSVCTSPHLLAFGGGHLLTTQAMGNIAGEFSGPLAYAVSLGMISISAVQMYRHHQEWGNIGNGAMGLVGIAGLALGSASVLGMIPGVAGAVI